MEQLIFHIDLNAFYASAELIRHPELQGKPLVVAGTSRRSVITTASYEARAFLIHSGMPVSQAVAVYPGLVVVPPDFSYYQALSKQFFTYLTKYTTLIEPASIDEGYLDLSAYLTQDKPLDLAFTIQKDLLEQLQLPCSIGISYNKFLAKMASDLFKPQGISIIRPNEIESKLWPIPIEKMHGVGKVTAQKLKKLNIFTIGDLAQYNQVELLVPIFGKNTTVFLDYALGQGSSEISSETDIKSISQSSTFMEDIADYQVIADMFYHLAKKLVKRLNRQQLVANTITVTIRYADFTTVNKSKTLTYFLTSYPEIIAEALALFDQNYTEEPVRLVGIALTNLKPETEYTTQLTLF